MDRDRGATALPKETASVGEYAPSTVNAGPSITASGADGPWRIGPNMMVVVPTDTHVELTYGRSSTDYLTMLLTLIGIGDPRRRDDAAGQLREPPYPTIETLKAMPQPIQRGASKSAGLLTPAGNCR